MQVTSDTRMQGAGTAASPLPVDDVGALEAELREAVTGEVRFDQGTRALYAHDSSVYRQPPIGVVIPRTVDDVVQAVAAARRHGAPVLARGCGTSLEGQCCNVALVIDFSKYMHDIIALDPHGQRARVQPGVICDQLRDAAERYHLTFGPDPATHNHCTLGGMIGNNSCGVHSVMAGKTSDNIEEMEILTYDGLRMRIGQTGEEELLRIIAEGGRRGEIYAGLKALRDKYAPLIREKFPNIPRCISGYNLPELLPERGFHVARALVGSESTCVTVLEATTRLVPSPPGRALLILGYPDAYSAADHVMEVMAHTPIGLEGFDSRLLEDLRKKHTHLKNMALLPDGGGWLLAEFGGADRGEAAERAGRLMADLKGTSDAPAMRLLEDPAQQQMIWEVRESGVGASSAIPGEPLTWPSWEDAAVPPAKLGNYLREFRALMDKHGYIGAFFGHFGQGCIHVRISFDLRTAKGIAGFRAFMYEAAALVVRYGGSLSGEHGDGQAHAELLPLMFGHELIEAFREFKAIWDPAGKMNPGKIVNAYRMDQNLRLGRDYNPWLPKTHFQFPDDQGSFANATLRCIGVGKCRRMEGGTMCPSFMVTREEADTTRGRARLLFEMLQGEVTADGWKDEHIKEALDLCLACKGCKGDCPVNVDMATYKAEFLSHYYEGRRRPVTAYTMGLIFRWARLAALSPGLANLATQTPGLRGVAKRLAGIAPQRRVPRFAPQTFQHWFAQRGHDGETGMDRSPVVLWPDTFNTYFQPDTAKAAVEVLEDAGYHVIVPTQPLCCGRPLYDYGMLDQAKKQLGQVLRTLRPYIRAGVPVVGLEPSCAAVFRDELLDLFPHEVDAHRLSEQTFLLSEFLETQATHYRPPRLARKALVQAHCHHKAIMKLDAEESLLRKLGLDFSMPESGCCGMAGSFGFEERHYDVSLKCGERALLPAVRAAADDTLIIANGFSCREQINQTTNRQALHLAQILQLALHGAGNAPAETFPEQQFGTDGAVHTPLGPRAAALAGVGALLGGAALARRVWGKR